MPETKLDLFSEMEKQLRLNPRWGNPNPMVQKFGIMPDQKCSGCALLEIHRWSKSRTKCSLRGVKGISTDHNSRFDACAKFQAGQNKVVYHG